MNADAQIACVDVGNSRTHVGLVQNDSLLSSIDFTTKNVAYDLSQWLSKHQFDGISWCTVVPALSDELETLFNKYSKQATHVFHENTPGLKISYPYPPEVGEDRLVNAIAAQHLTGAPAIVLDAGTAITYDVILPEAGYIGGLIAPGLAIMTDYLHEKTARLPKLPLDSLSTDAPFGISTAESMSLACAVGFKGMVSAMTERVLKEVSDRGYSEPALLATGGSIQHLFNENDIWRWVPGLTFLGLAEAWRREQTNALT